MSNTKLEQENKELARKIAEIIIEIENKNSKNN
jgi:hypothetical protein